MQKQVKIKMIKTTKGSPNGIIVQDYLEGEEYTVNESLACNFYLMKVADPVKSFEKKEEKGLENKAYKGKKVTKGK